MHPREALEVDVHESDRYARPVPFDDGVVYRHVLRAHGGPFVAAQPPPARSGSHPRPQIAAYCAWRAAAPDAQHLVLKESSSEKICFASGGPHPCVCFPEHVQSYLCQHLHHRSGPRRSFTGYDDDAESHRRFLRGSNIPDNELRNLHPGSRGWFSRRQELLAFFRFGIEFDHERGPAYLRKQFPRHGRHGEPRLGQLLGRNDD